MGEYEGPISNADVAKYDVQRPMFRVPKYMCGPQRLTIRHFRERNPNVNIKPKKPSEMGANNSLHNYPEKSEKKVCIWERDLKSSLISNH